MAYSSYISEKLVEELRKIFDDDEFVTGILVFADNDDDRETVLEFIRRGDDVNVETVTVLALDLDEARSKLA